MYRERHARCEVISFYILGLDWVTFRSLGGSCIALKCQVKVRERALQCVKHFLGAAKE